MKVSFYSNRIKFSGDTLEKVGLGGSESALINISTCWKKQFPVDEITVYNGNDKREKQDYNGVIYKTMTDFYSDIRSMNIEAFISLREMFPFKLPYIDSKLKILWSQDDMNEGDLQKLQINKYARGNIDFFFAISDYAKREIQKGFPKKEVLLQRNGYREDWIDNSENLKDMRYPVAVYTSTPFRGLDVLAQCWKEIYDKCVIKGFTPTLKVCTGMSLYQQSEDSFKNLYDHLRSLPMVEFIGAIPQRKLYEELKECKVMLYPNHFLETGAMSVLEALANNLWIVTTDLGALGEQVRDGVNGFLIGGDAHSEEYKRQFIQLSVDSLCESLVPINPNSSGLIFSWEEQAVKMRKAIEERIHL